MKQVIIIVGAPGSGKGTQSKILKNLYNIAHISTGDMLRSEVADKTPLGVEIKDMLDKGLLIADDLMTNLIKQRIVQDDCVNGFILDGYPRTLAQAKLLDNIFMDLNILDYKVIKIDVSDEIIIQRILGRYSCSDCNSIYNDYFLPTSVVGICDNCGSANLIRRTDDKLETVENRLKSYHEYSIPVLSYYRDKNKLFMISGNEDSENSKKMLSEILN